jgi:bilirubin oxidase
MVSQTLYLKSFASELPNGIYGADTVGFGADTIHEYTENFLNGADFNLLQINVVSQTGTPVTTIANALVPYTPFNPITATNYRTLTFDTIRLLPIDPPNRAEGPFGINNQTFNMDSINEVVHLNTTEVWTLVNKTLVAHPFHIHDIEFNIIEKSGLPPTPSETGWKDVVLVMPNDSVKFITKFTTFADNITPYMYHCHLLHHEDDGMMGSFLVIDTTASTGIADINFKNNFSIYPNPTTEILNIVSNTSEKFSVSIFNTLGEKITSANNIQHLQLNINNYPSGLYFIQINSDNKFFTQKFIKQ